MCKLKFFLRVWVTVLVMNFVWASTAFAQLQTPSLQTPSDGSGEHVDQSIYFDWANVSGATVYRIRIGTSRTGVDNDTCSGCIVDTTTSSSNFSLSANTLSVGTTYYWTVRAGNSSEGSLFASPFRLEGTLPGFGAPSLQTPSDGSGEHVDQSIYFDWANVSGATVYRIRIGTSRTGVDNDTCSGCIVDTTTSSSNFSLSANTLSVGTTYYWTVRAGNSSTGQGGVFASPFSLSGTLPGFGAPSLQTPSDGSTFSATQSISFDWSNVSGATAYRIRIGTSRTGVDNDTCSGCVTDERVTSSNYQLPANRLGDGTTYYWTVRAGNSSTGQGGVFAQPRTLSTTNPTTCVDECSAGTNLCANASTLRRCLVGADGCMDWNEVPCSSNETCEAGTCVETNSCQPECMLGERACVDSNTLQTCTQVDGCERFVVEMCMGECSSGRCVECAGANQECGFDECGQYAGDCSIDEICVSGSCQNMQLPPGQNPSPAQIDAKIQELVTQFPIEWIGHDGTRRVGYVPSQVVRAVAWGESGWRHYDGDGNVLKGQNGDSVDYGIMQVNGEEDDESLLGMPWQENLRRGIEILVGKWQQAAFEYEDPSILENWYYPLAYYNGFAGLGSVNDPSLPGMGSQYYDSHPELLGRRVTYQDKIFAFIEQPEQAGVSRSVLEGSSFKAIPGYLARPYAIPGWLGSGSWSSQGRSAAPPYTSEQASFGRNTETTPSLQAFGQVIYRWVEDGRGGRAVPINPGMVSTPPTGSNNLPVGESYYLQGWQPRLSTRNDEAKPYRGQLVLNDRIFEVLTFVVSTPSGNEFHERFDEVAGEASVDLGEYAFDPAKYGGQTGRYIVGLWGKVQNQTATQETHRFAVAEIHVTNAGFALLFPLAGETPWTARINSVFDHSLGAPYSRDGSVVAFTGESASSATPCTGLACGYKSSDGSGFIVNGNYTAAGFSTTNLWYEGHPGYDFRAQTGDDLYATSSGVVSHPTYNGTDRYKVLEIDHQNGYVTRFLHCSERLVEAGTYVEAGELVARVGSAGTSASHLHMEILHNDVPVDPYGWQGDGPDPHSVVSTFLWQEVDDRGGIALCLTNCPVGTVCRGSRCIVDCTDGSACPSGQQCINGLCDDVCESSSPEECLFEGIPAPENTGSDPSVDNKDSSQEKEDCQGCAQGSSGSPISMLLWVLGFLSVRRFKSRRRL